MSSYFLWMLSVRMLIRNKGAWYWIGSCDPPLDNKGDGIKRIATIVKTMVSVDFFTVPTIRFQVLYVLLVLAHDRRRILAFPRHHASDGGVDRAAVAGGISLRPGAEVSAP